MLALAIAGAWMTYGQSTAEPFVWKADWITVESSTSDKSDVQPPGVDGPVLPLFRHQFRVHGTIAQATLRISGLGQYEAHINQRNVTDAVLTPGWTDYGKRVFYDTYDVTSMVHPGSNAIGIMLGRGMYDVRQTKGRYTKFNRSFGALKLILQLDIRYKDGSAESVSSDANWRTATGPITYSSVYGGETYDARLELAGWDDAGFDDAAWSHATATDGPGGRLVPENIPPVKAFDRLDPIAITHPAPGVSVYDLGRNFAGWPEITVSGKRGAQLKMIAGELLDARGFVTQRSTGASPENENAFTYVLKGTGLEGWHPRFSSWGFRYVQVTGDDAMIHYLDGRFLHDAVSVEGSFTTSNDLLNRIHTLIDRAMLSNMVSVMTDCPHREKLGWLEQTHLAGSSLMYNYDLAALYGKIADDMQDAQLPNGLVPDIAPEYPVFEGAFRDSPEWGVAHILSTWTAYQFYGDRKLLRDHYGSMASYLDYLKEQSQQHLLLYGLGDWYDIGPGAPGPSKRTSKGLTATALYYQSLTTMVRIAALTGHEGDVKVYGQEADVVKAAFNRRYFHPGTNQYDQGSQTANAIPLVAGLTPDDLRAAVLANLVADIREHANHVTAGDIGFHYVVRALTDGGRSDVLYDMLSRTDNPSYGDQLAHGATTLTEAWDANPDSSQNHFMLGHAEEWFYRGLAGIDFNMDRDTNERITIHPAIIRSIRRVKATYNSRLGRVGSAWSLYGRTLRMTVVIPAGSKATIVLPSGFVHVLRDERPARRSGATVNAPGKSSLVRCVVGPGRHLFRLERTSE